MDDDYSPEEAFRRFSTPSRNNNNNNSHPSNEPTKVKLTAEDIFDIMNRGGAGGSDLDIVDPFSDSIPFGVNRGSNLLNTTTGYVVNESLIDLLDPV